MKLTMTTPGGKRTIELPEWLERRIIGLFVASTKAVPIGEGELTTSEQRTPEVDKGGK